MNKYTIILPVYNCEKYISRCLESLIKQDYSNIEIILIDDGSTDNTAKICDEYRNKDSRITCKHINNEGVSNARNIGLKMATGDYVTFVDADDYVDSKTISSINKIILSENVDIVKYGYYKELNKIKIKNKFKTVTNKKIYKKSYKKLIEPYIFSTNDFGNVWNAFFNKEILKNLIFDINLKYGEDRKFMMDSLLKSNSIYI